MAMASANDPATVTVSILPSGRGFPTASMDPECLAILAYARLLHASSLAAASPLTPSANHALPPWFATEPARLNPVAYVPWTAEDGKLPMVRCACGANKSGALG